MGTQEETFTKNNISTNTTQIQVQAEDEPIPTPNMGTMDTEHINLSQLACLLCKRKFNSKDQLMKHIQVSDLHKVCSTINLTTYRPFSALSYGPFNYM